MSNRQNPNRIASDNVGNVKRKDSQIDAPVAARAQAIQFGMVGNPQNAPVHFIFETLSQAIASLFVIGDGIEELVPGLLNKSKDHGVRSLVASIMTSS